MNILFGSSIGSLGLCVVGYPWKNRNVPYAEGVGNYSAGGKQAKFND